VLEVAVGALALGEQPVLRREIPTDCLAVLLAAPIAGERGLRKRNQQRPVRFACQHAVAELQAAEIGLGALRQSVRGAPCPDLLRRGVGGGGPDRSQLTCGELGGQLLVGFGQRRRAVEAIERLEEGLVAGGHVVAPGVGERRPFPGVGTALRRRGLCCRRGANGADCNGFRRGRGYGRGIHLCSACFSVGRPRKALHRTITQHGSPRSCALAPLTCADG
jgi:hypothetical protein